MNADEYARIVVHLDPVCSLGLGLLVDNGRYDELPQESHG